MTAKGKYIIEPSKDYEGYYGVRRVDSSIYCYQSKNESHCRMMLERYNNTYRNSLRK
jgi:hypothetical protein